MEKDNSNTPDNTAADVAPATDSIPSVGQPVTTPQSTVAEPAQSVQPVAEKTAANPGLIILQWLTYAFWGWTVLALSFLTATVVSNYVTGSDSSSFSAYAIAAVLVLLPISFVCDSFYSKREPAKKVGAEVWVMVIHAVLFALFAIGALITAVFSVVALLTSSGNSDGVVVTLVSALIIAGFYGLTFLRTLNPARITWLRRGYRFIMLATVGVLAIVGIVGPAAQARLTRDDRLISDNISTVSSQISTYADNNQKLPESLEALNLSGDAGELIDRRLVVFEPKGKVVTSDPSLSSDTNLRSSSVVDQYRVDTHWRYQLCVNYKKDQTSRYGSYSYSDSVNADSEGYGTYVTADQHPAGRVCYKLRTGY